MFGYDSVVGLSDSIGYNASPVFQSSYLSIFLYITAVFCVKYKLVSDLFSNQFAWSEDWWHGRYKKIAGITGDGWKNVGKNLREISMRGDYEIEWNIPIKNNCDSDKGW